MRVSAVVPARLPAPYLAEALSSLRAQTHPLDEILLVAHGWSPDLTDPMLADVRVLEVSGEHTFPDLLNAALKAAKGDLILRLDSDDVALPHRLQSELEALAANPTAVAVTSAVEFMDADGVSFGTGFVDLPGRVPASKMLARNVVAHPTVLFRRSAALAVGGYGAVSLCEDYDLWLRMATRGEFIRLSEPTIRYRTHSGQSTAGRRVPRSAWRQLGESRRALAKAQGLPRAVADLRHALWCFAQLLPRSLGPRRYQAQWPNSVAVMLTGGLGNQLFQMAAALDLAHGRNVFAYPDLGSPRRHDGRSADALLLKFSGSVQTVSLRSNAGAQGLSRKAAGYLLRIGVIGSAIEQHQSFRKVAAGVGSRVVSRVLPERRTIFAARGVGSDPLVSAVQGRPLLVGYFQTWRHVMAPHVLSEMRSAIEGIGEPWFSEMRGLADEEQPIIVHIRLGDYRKEPGLGLISQQYYAAAIAAARESLPQSRIWLFSDEPEAALAMLPAHEVLASPRIVDPPTPQTHPAELMRVMSLGRRFVLGNSTFGWWAAMLSEYAVDVCAPTPWFALGEQPRDLIPAHWTSRSRESGEVFE